LRSKQIASSTYAENNYIMFSMTMNQNFALARTVNIFDKQWWTANKGCSSILGVGGADNSSL